MSATSFWEIVISVDARMTYNKRMQRQGKVSRILLAQNARHFALPLMRGVRPHVNAMRIETDDVSKPEVLALLLEHLRNMHEITPAGQVFAFDANKLRAKGVVFWTAWEDKVLLGCAALKELSSTQGEIKSMRKSSNLRRRGIGRALLEHVLQVSRQRGYGELFLETGSHPAFIPAQTLYRSVGFRECGPFGDYKENGFSVFMSLRLDGASAA